MAKRQIVRVDPAEPALSKRPRRPGYVRLTCDVPVGLDIRLGALAKVQGELKGAFIVRMLDQGCRKYTMDDALRSAFAEIPGQADPAA